MHQAQPSSSSVLVQLLDDGTGRDPLEVHNFGKGGKYLFRPCQNEDGTLDEVRSMSDKLRLCD